METTIPFSGFYESVWSDAVDRCEELDVENLVEGDGDPQFPTLEAREIHDAMYRFADYTKAYKQIAKDYVAAFEGWINEEFNLHITLTYKLMTSPREYNFMTDRIFCEISRDDVAQLYKKVGREPLRQMAEQRFTSRSGFSSFYSPRIENWGSVRDWDHNQLGTLFEAAVQLTDKDNDLAFALVEIMNEDIYHAWENCVDWDALFVELRHMVNVQNGEAEEDARKFPPSGLDPELYVTTFCELNHLKAQP